MYLVYDIETIPESEVACEWHPSEEDVRRGNGDPFPPIWAHRVVTIGALVMDRQHRVLGMSVISGGAVAAAGRDDGEREMVAKFIELASGQNPKMPSKDPLTLVDYNGRSFDLPVLQHRAHRYGLPLSFYFGRIPDNKGQISSFSKTYRDRYGGQHEDLAELWNNSGAFAKSNLKVLAKLMGLPGKLEADGTKTHEMFKAGNFEGLDRYVMFDVVQTAFLYYRYKLISGVFHPEVYTDRASALLQLLKDKPGYADLVAKIDENRLLLR